ncbi:MAG: hypothetical protein SW127_04910 [Actinomycetota bacterium]|nr:hypothetical protein [Actinomycetota bacterium]
MTPVFETREESRNDGIDERFGPSIARTGGRDRGTAAAVRRYVERQLSDPTPGTTWHPLYRWPSDTDEDYRQRVTEHERTQQKTSGRPAGESEER